MPLSRDFKETIRERARRDAAFREALLKEAVDACSQETWKPAKSFFVITSMPRSASTSWRPSPKNHQRASCVCLGQKVTLKPVTSLRLSPIFRKKKASASKYGDVGLPHFDVLRLIKTCKFPCKSSVLKRLERSVCPEQGRRKSG